MNFVRKIIYILCFLFVFGCSNQYSKNEPPEFITVITQENKHIFYGIVKSQTVSNLSFETEGKIEYLPYTKGDFVKKGEILAKLNGELYNIKKTEQTKRVQNAKIKLEQIKNNYERMTTLHKEGAISDNDWEDVYFSLKSQEKEIEIEKATLNYINKEISLNSIKAPFDGYIEDKFANVGAYAKIGVPILTLISNNETLIETNVQSDFINRIYLNQNVIIKKDEISYAGKIAHISTVSSKNGGYLVKIYLNKKEPLLKDGMSVDVIIPFKNEENIYIPSYALQEKNGVYFVYRLLEKRDKKAILTKTVVKAKIIDEKNYKIIEGLKSNDIILINNFEKIKNDEIKL